MDIMNEEYFFPKNDIRTKIYENMQNDDNKAIIHVIQQFVTDWSNITFDTAFTFSSVVKQVNQNLYPEKNEDQNNSMEGSSKEIPIPKTFDECF